MDLSLIAMIVSTSISSSNLFLYCYNGQLASDRYLAMANILFESKWYCLPLEMQKYFLLMIGNAQQNLYYHGFDLARLNLQTYCQVRLWSWWQINIPLITHFFVESFVQILRTVVSYYMVFKTMTIKKWFQSEYLMVWQFGVFQQRSSVTGYIIPLSLNNKIVQNSWIYFWCRYFKTFHTIKPLRS